MHTGGKQVKVKKNFSAQEAFLSMIQMPEAVKERLMNSTT